MPPEAGSADPTDIPALERENQGLQADLKMMALTLGRYEDSLARLQSEFSASRTEVTALRTVLLNQDNLIKVLQNHVADISGVLTKEQERRSELEQLGANLALQLGEARAEAGRARAEVAQLKASMSWRVTAPLRTVVTRVYYNGLRRLR